METVQITLTLPKDLVEEAQEFDLLSPEKITSILRDAVDKAVMDFVNAEIKAYRAEKAAEQQANSQQ